MTSTRGALLLSLLCALGGCDHQNEPPATPAGATPASPADASPADASPAEGMPSEAPPVETTPTKPEKDSNDGSGSSSPIPGGSNELKAPARG
jgi:hypothetical protein